MALLLVLWLSESQSSDDDVPRPLKERESEGADYTKAEKGRGDGLSCTATLSPGGRTAEKSGDDGEDGRTTEGEVGDSSHFEEETVPPKGLENGHREYDHAGCEPRFQQEAGGYGSSEANRDAYSGAPQRGKPTWQVCSLRETRQHAGGLSRELAGAFRYKAVRLRTDLFSLPFVQSRARFRRVCGARF